MNCKTAKPLLGRLRDGELDPGLARELEDHLLDCPACRAELAGLESLGAALRSGFAAPPPDGLAERAFQAAMASDPAPRSLLSALFPIAWPAAVATSVAALVLVGWTLVASPAPAAAQTSLLDGVVGTSSAEQVQDVLQGALGIELDDLASGDTR